MPAEWEEQASMWLALPHDKEEWGRFYAEARASVVRLANTLAATQRVDLLVPSEAMLSKASEALPQLLDDVVVHPIPYGDIWLRDTGPIFVARGENREAISFAFNGWGEKYIFDNDPDVGHRVAALKNVSCRNSALVAEGGALDSNGVGTFLSTKECLLNTNRNPGLDASAIESELAVTLGCRKLIWLDQGLAGDHTDGHVDNLARFVGPRTVVCMAPSGPDDPNHEVLLQVRATLDATTTADGEALEVLTIPSPGRVEGPSGVMAASYCNFLIANKVVIVPTFGVANDEAAVAALAALFPDRKSIAHPAYALLTGGGTVHCISQQEPLHE
mgnify:CR=1 FL=1